MDISNQHSSTNPYLYGSSTVNPGEHNHLSSEDLQRNGTKTYSLPYPYPPSQSKVPDGFGGTGGFVATTDDSNGLAELCDAQQPSSSLSCPSVVIHPQNGAAGGLSSTKINDGLDQSGSYPPHIHPQQHHYWPVISTHSTNNHTIADGPHSSAIPLSHRTGFNDGMEQPTLARLSPTFISSAVASATGFIFSEVASTLFGT